MKRILNVFLLILTISFSGTIFAANSASENFESINPIANVSDLEQMAVEGKCGVISYSGKEVVSPRDFSVCENDISYSILEIIFQKVINENEILSVLVEKSDSRAEAAYSYNIGGPIISVIESVTWLTFMFSGLIFSYVMIKTLNISASSGKFMRDWNSVYVMTRTLAAMAIIFPIGSFSIAQTIILVFAIFAIMGANYVWGAFLSMQTAQTMILSQEEAGYLRLAHEQAESLALTNVCSVRTAALSLELYKSSNTNWMTGLENSEQLSRLGNCSRNYNYMIVDQEMIKTKTEGRNKTTSTNALPMSKLVYGSPINCKGGNDYIDQYSAEKWGPQYFCGEVSFAVPSLSDYLDKNDDLNGWFSDADEDIANAVYDFKKSYDSERLFYTIRDKAIQQTNDKAPLNTKLFENEIEKLKSAMVSKLSPVFEKVKTRIAKESDSTNPPLAYEALMMATNAAFGGLMGGSYDEAGYNDFWQKFMSAKLFSSDGLFAYNKLTMVDLDSENKIGYSPLYVAAKEIALLNMSSHCARNWREYISVFDATKRSLKKAEDEVDGKFNTDMPLSTNCIVPISISSSNIDSQINPDYYYPLASFNSGSGKIVYALTLAGNSRDALINLSSQEANAQDAIYKSAAQEIIKYSDNKAKGLIEGIAAYYFVVRTATSRAMAEMYQQETDDTLLIKMRDLGWASAGGFILTLANNGSDLNSHSNQIQSSVSWGNSVTNDKALHTTAIEATNSSKITFLSMNSTLSNIYTAAIDQNELVTVDSISSTDFSDLLSGVEDFLTAPMKHLKYVGGFDQNKTLREGAKACYEEGECKITEIHPVTALMTMGNEIIEVSFWVLVAKAITGTLAYIDAKATTGKSSNGQGIIKMFFSKSPLGMLLSVGSMIDPFMKILAYYIIPPIFTVGVFFSFIVPMMPFLAFLMGFIGWIMLILELLIAVNVWVIMMATPDSNGASRADPRALFNFAGQLLLKPALMIIALVFGWYLSAISIYFLNMTIFGALSPTETKGLSGLFDVFMFYTVYLIMVFVAIKHSFKIIEILPDKIFGLLNINSMNDIKSDSLGMEKLMQLAATQKVFSLASMPVQNLDAKKDALKREIEAENRKKLQSRADAVTNKHHQQAEDQEKMNNSLNDENTKSENKNTADKKLGTDGESKTETASETMKRMAQKAKEKRSTKTSYSKGKREGTGASNKNKKN